MEIKVGRLYEDSNGQFGLCVNAHEDQRLLAFVVSKGDRGLLMKTYKDNGTADGLPTLVKLLWELP